MKRFLAFFLPMVLTIGCTPLGEDVVRKAEKPTTSSVEGQSLAQSGYEAHSAPLDPPTRSIIHDYGSTIKKYSDRYGFDWRLIMAMMKQESRFAPGAESRQGAIGLMQIMPVTEVEVSRILDVDDLSHPHNNIRGGIYYLRRLYDLFEGADEPDRTELALAAYNAGISRVLDAQKVAAYLHDDPRKWESIRDALPLLSKRFYTLHRNVWGEDRPSSGYFGNSRQTVRYVESIMSYYDDYRLYLN